MPTGVDPFLRTPAQVGALAGYSDGMRMSYGLADLDRQFRDSDLKNQRDQNTYENELLDNSNKASKREYELTKNEFDTGLYNDGTMLNRAASETSKQAAEAEGAQLKLKVAKALDAADEVQRNAPFFIKNQGLDSIPAYDEFRKAATASGVKNLPTSHIGPDNQSKIKFVMDSAIRSVPHLQKMEEQTNAGNIAENNAAKRDAAALERAKVIAAASEKKGETTGDPLKRAVNSVQEKASKGEVVSAEEISAIAALSNKSDPEKIDKATNLVVNSIRQARLEGEPAYKKVLETFGLDIKEYPLNSDVRLVAKAAATKTVKAIEIREAYQAGGSPKITEETANSLFSNDEEFVKKLKAEGKVLRTPAAGTPQVKKETPKTSSKDQDLREKYYKAYPNRTKEEVDAALIKKGLISKPITQMAPVSMDTTEPTSGLSYEGID